MPRNLSKLANFLKNCRGTTTHKDFAAKLAAFFNEEIFISYSHLANIEADRKSPDQSKFLRLCTEFIKIDHDTALAMWVEQKRLVEANRKFKKKIDNLQKEFNKKNTLPLED